MLEADFEADCAFAFGFDLALGFAFEAAFDFAFGFEAAFAFFGLAFLELVPFDLEAAFVPFPLERLCELLLPLDPVLVPLLVFVVAIVPSLPIDQNPYLVGYPGCL